MLRHVSQYQYHPSPSPTDARSYHASSPSRLFRSLAPGFHDSLQVTNTADSLRFGAKSANEFPSVNELGFVFSFCIVGVEVLFFVSKLNAYKSYEWLELDNFFLILNFILIVVGLVFVFVGIDHCRNIIRRKQQLDDLKREIDDLTQRLSRQSHESSGLLLSLRILNSWVLHTTGESRRSRCQRGQNQLNQIDAGTQVEHDATSRSPAPTQEASCLKRKEVFKDEPKDVPRTIVGR